MAYAELNKTVTINIIDFVQFKTVDAYHTQFELLEKQERILLTDCLQIHFVELPKLLRKWRNKEVNPWENRLVRWLLMLEAAENGEILKELERLGTRQTKYYFIHVE